MRQPCYGVRLARAGRVLHEVVVPRPITRCLRDELIDAAMLVPAREDELAQHAPQLAPPLRLLVHQEVLDDVEQRVPAPGVAPQVLRGVAAVEHRDGRVARPSIVASVERDEERVRPLQLGADLDHIRVHGEVSEAAAELQERLALRATVISVLADRVSEILTCEWVLQLGGDDWYAVDEQHEVDRVPVPDAVVDLPDHCQHVGLELGNEVGVPARGGREVGESEAAAEQLEIVAQDIERAALGDLLRDLRLQ